MEKPIYYDGSGNISYKPNDSKNIVIKPDTNDKPSPDLSYPFPVIY